MAVFAFLTLALAGLAAPSPAHAAPKVPAGSFQTLYSFCQLDSCDDGYEPESGVVVTASGTVFGTTCYGGADDEGTVFSITKNGVETVRGSFTGDNGYCPEDANLLAVGTDQFFGTTYEGGANNCGTAFELSKNTGGKWVLTVLYNFGAYGGDGCDPSGGLVKDKKGNLYGFTSYGGANSDAACYEDGEYGCGAAFELSPPKQKGQPWTETVIYSFCSQTDCADGSYPGGTPAIDAKGTVYGTAYYGGNEDYGTLFALPPYGSAAVLYTFCQLDFCADGAAPWGVALDSRNNLYGFTVYGGAGYYETSYDDGYYGYYGGTVFKYAKAGTYSVLYSFCQDVYCSDGFYPWGTPAIDKTGNIYGTGNYGGPGSCSDDSGFGCGVVFEILHNVGEAVLHGFSGDDGVYPSNGVTLDAKGNLYGVTAYGGSEDSGTVFVLKP